MGGCVCGVWQRLLHSWSPWLRPLLRRGMLPSLLYRCVCACGCGAVVWVVVLCCLSCIGFLHNMYKIYIHILHVFVSHVSHASNKPNIRPPHHVFLLWKKTQTIYTTHGAPPHSLLRCVQHQACSQSAEKAASWTSFSSSHTLDWWSYTHSMPLGRAPQLTQNTCSSRLGFSMYCGGACLVQ